MPYPHSSSSSSESQPNSSDSEPSTDPEPAVDSVAFETGNPETGFTSNGTLDLTPFVPTSCTIVVESVPGLMSSPDFCIFVRPFFDAILHIRPLRLKTEQNRYIIILSFRNPSDAANFILVYEGKYFLHGLVQETCTIRSVQNFAFQDAPELPNFPNSAMFPDERADAISSSCPVCLEPLNARPTALFTTFCNHTMHADCLAQWDLNRCPVCRHTHELTPEASTCMNCNHRDDLWMCVVCAYVGCGVYKNKHAHAHFAETQHPFAINLEDCTFWSGETVRQGSVWDYVSERFVNRLLSSDDGKIVEVAQDPSRSNRVASSSASGATCCAGGGDVGIVEDEEHDRAFQAALYASRMDAVVDDYRARLERMEAEHAAEKLGFTEQIEALGKEISQLNKTRKGLTKKGSEHEREMKNMKDRNGFLKELNETLLRDKKGWNEQVENMKSSLTVLGSEKQNLEEQMRDLMMHLETQSKIAGSMDPCRSDISELQGGDVVRVGPSPRKRLSMKANRR